MKEPNVAWDEQEWSYPAKHEKRGPSVMDDADPGLMVSEILYLYLVHLEGRASYNPSLSVVRLHLEPALGRLPAAALRCGPVVELIEKLAREGKRRTAGACITVLRAAFNRARRLGRLTAGPDPTEGLKAFRGGHRKRVACPDELTRLAEALTTMAARDAGRTGNNTTWSPAVALYRLLLLTGARPCELRRARWADLDPTGRLIRLTEHKTAALIDEPREIHLSPAAFAFIEALPRLPGNPYLFPGRRPGRPLADAKAVWRRACARAGIVGLTPYDLRRTFASLALNRGWSLDAIGQALGHRTAETTRRYAWLLPASAGRLAADVAAGLPDGWAGR